MKKKVLVLIGGRDVPIGYGHYGPQKGQYNTESEDKFDPGR